MIIDKASEFICGGKTTLPLVQSSLNPLETTILLISKTKLWFINQNTSIKRKILHQPFSYLPILASSVFLQALRLSETYSLLNFSGRAHGNNIRRFLEHSQKICLLVYM